MQRTEGGQENNKMARGSYILIYLQELIISKSFPAD